MTVKTAPARATAIYPGWYIVLLCVVAHLATSSLLVNAFSLFLRPWSREMHTPISTFLLSVGAMGSVGAFLAPITGTLADKYPARILLSGGLIALVIGLVAISLAREAWQIIATYVLILPIAVTLTSPVVANPVISRWFVRRLGLALGVTGLGLGIGGVIAPPIVATALVHFGWRAIWRGAAALALVVVLPLTFLLVKDWPAVRDDFYQPGGDPGAATHGHRRAGGDEAMSWRQILSSRNLWLIVAMYLPMLALYGVCLQNIAPIAASRGWSERSAGMLMSALSVGQLTATLGSGALSDRLGNRVPLVGLALACAVGGTIVAFARDIPLCLLGVVLVAFGGSFWPVLAAALATEFGASRVGRAFGTVSFFLPLSLLAPFSVAKLQEATGSYVPGIMAMVAVTLLGAVAGLFLREKPRVDVAAGEPAIS